MFSSVDCPDDRELLLPYDELWLETLAHCVTILSLKLLVFPGRLIYWVHGVSLQLVYKQPVSLSHFLHSQFQIRKDPHPLIPLMLRQVSPWLCPSTRQGMHLPVALENSTLRRVLNFFSPCFQVSLKL